MPEALSIDSVDGAGRQEPRRNEQYLRNAWAALTLGHERDAMSECIITVT